MTKLLCSHVLLSEKSKETGISFSGLLGGAVLEEIVRRIGASEYKETLWLRNEQVLGEKQYKKKLLLSLEYAYAVSNPENGDGLSALADDLKQKVFEGKSDYGISFSQKSVILKKCLSLSLSARLEDMRIPVSVKIYPVQKDRKHPGHNCFSCTLFPEVTAAYYSCPAEEILAERYLEIVTRLELIRDMEAYYDVYRLLERERVDARKVKEYVEEGCRDLLSGQKERLPDIIAGYKNYGFMKKKWKAFLRSINSSEPAWEMAVDRFSKFFGPIWQSILEDVVFFGDWMPELNRFL